MTRMFKQPKMPGPTAEEIQAKEAEEAERAKREKELQAESERVRLANERQESLRASNRTGARSLISGDWAGFQRGADMGAQ